LKSELLYLPITSNKTGSFVLHSDQCFNPSTELVTNLIVNLDGFVSMLNIVEAGAIILVSLLLTAGEQCYKQIQIMYSEQ